MTATGFTPLWPAGHLPLKGGDYANTVVAPDDWRKLQCQPISPLVGEMAGRPEGGAKKRDLGRIQIHA
ncbi:assimilatory nitrate reductase (NADH) subunit alpha [Nitratireductor pacificus pht-3B]|uniref:Assimilatory nitrate reductase (NADH) subunit alpha n=1 Tax=Nitratireductor pacificus pht-3B TaxID=391937 RepID=K2MP81_9HYPH|nr:assimilatory nitrate reductase (NADH) subunit alpha [Nitratireductor pacificus pht-3B]